MRLLLLLMFVTYSDVAIGQTVRRAMLLQFRAYMIDMVSETMQEVEEFQWCNLKIPDFSQHVNYEFFGQKVSGDVSYKNGYVVTMQHLDITQSSVQQVWRWNSTDKLGTVDLQAQMRLHDVVLGFDVEANLNGKQHRYTSTFTHRLLSFNFLIRKNMRTKEYTVTVTGVDPKSTGRMVYVPSDKFSDLLGTSFVPADTVPGVLSWGPDIFQSRAYKVVTTKVEFPTVCYNC